MAKKFQWQQKFQWQPKYKLNKKLQIDFLPFLASFVIWACFIQCSIYHAKVHKSNLVKTMGASKKNALPKIISTYCGSVQSLAPQFAAVRKLGFSRVISQQRVRGNWASFFKAEIWFFALLYFNKWSTILLLLVHRELARFSSIPNVDWAI